MLPPAESLVNSAHRYDRKATLHVNSLQFKDAIECHLKAAECLEEAINTSQSEHVIASLKAQRDNHILQIKVMKSKQDALARKVEDIKRQRADLAATNPIFMPIQQGLVANQPFQPNGKFDHSSASSLIPSLQSTPRNIHRNELAFGGYKFEDEHIIIRQSPSGHNRIDLVFSGQQALSTQPFNDDLPALGRIPKLQDEGSGCNLIEFSDNEAGAYGTPNAKFLTPNHKERGIFTPISSQSSPDNKPLQLEIHRRIEEYDSLLQILLKKNAQGSSSSSPFSDHPRSTSASDSASVTESLYKSATKTPKDDKMIIEELRMNNEQLRQLISRLFNESDEVKKENEDLKARLDLQEQFNQELRHEIQILKNKLSQMTVEQGGDVPPSRRPSSQAPSSQASSQASPPFRGQSGDNRYGRHKHPDDFPPLDPIIY